MNKRLHAYYRGSVQGVGFRYTAERAAAPLGLNGWVKNTGDGRVEIVVEGDGAAIDKFLNKIESIFKDYIQDVDIEWGSFKDEFVGFDIRFD